MTHNKEQLARVIPLIPEVDFLFAKPARSADIPMPDYENFAAVSEVLAQVHDEMERQDVRWGQQNHPLLATDDFGTDEMMRLSCSDRAEHWKRTNDQRAIDGELGWDGILLEEVYEALSEDDADRAVVELIQVAAVAAQAALSIQRNGLGGEAAVSVKDVA